MHPIHFITAKLTADEQSHPILSHMEWLWRKITAICEVDLHHHCTTVQMRFDKGVETLGDMYEGCSIKSFGTLKETFNLLQNQF